MSSENRCSQGCHFNESKKEKKKSKKASCQEANEEPVYSRRCLDGFGYFTAPGGFLNFGNKSQCQSSHSRPSVKRSSKCVSTCEKEDLYYCEICQKYDRETDVLNTDWCRSILCKGKCNPSNKQQDVTATTDNVESPKDTSEEATGTPHPEEAEATAEGAHESGEESTYGNPGKETIAEEEVTMGDPGDENTKMDDSGGEKTMAEEAVGADFGSKAVSTGSGCPVAADCIAIDDGEDNSCPARATRSKEAAFESRRSFRCSGTCTSWCVNRSHQTE